MLRLWHLIVGHHMVDDGPLRIRCVCGAMRHRADWP